MGGNFVVACLVQTAPFDEEAGGILSELNMAGQHYAIN